MSHSRKRAIANKPARAAFFSSGSVNRAQSFSLIEENEKQQGWGMKRVREETQKQTHALEKECRRNESKQTKTESAAVDLLVTALSRISLGQRDGVNQSASDGVSAPHPSPHQSPEKKKPVSRRKI